MSDLMTLKKFETLSPFEIKDELIKLAKKTSRTSQSAFLNAGRGNPNWIATTPREGFFLLGQFAITESKRVMEHPAGLGGMPAAPGIASRLAAYLSKNKEMPGAEFLASMVPFAVKLFGFEPDAFVHELVDSIIGDNYPVPDRMLVHNERITHEYLMWAMCGSPHPKGKFDLYAVEGGTAAMCYIFKSLKANRLLKQGDTIALGHADLHALHRDDPPGGLRAQCREHPGDAREPVPVPGCRAQEARESGGQGVLRREPGQSDGRGAQQGDDRQDRQSGQDQAPDLMLLTDDVYGTFVRGFRSLLGELPHNTIGVYSYSKYFGCTGWRLGVIAVHEDNLYDKAIAKLPDGELKALDKRYLPITLEPRKLKFIDRIVADSRDVALNHTAGLSLPQQVMMSLFSLYELMDTAKAYQAACMEIVHRRAKAMIEGLGIDAPTSDLYDAYYGLIDFEFWARRNIGEEAVQYLKKNIHPLDLAFRLAEQHGIVLLNGGGFDAPDWSLRVSLANLGDDVYDDIGRGVRSIARGYRDAYEASKKAPKA